MLQIIGLTPLNSCYQHLWRNLLARVDRSHLLLVLTVKEAAEYLRFSESTILRLANQGFIPGAKIGRQWRFSKETILNLVKHPEMMQKAGMR